FHYCVRYVSFLSLAFALVYLHIYAMVFYVYSPCDNLPLAFCVLIQEEIFVLSYLPNKKSSSVSSASPSSISSASSEKTDSSCSNPCSLATDSLFISIFQPVNLAARRAC